MNDGVPNGLALHQLRSPATVLARHLSKLQGLIRWQTIINRFPFVRLCPLTSRVQIEQDRDQLRASLTQRAAQLAPLIRRVKFGEGTIDGAPV